MKVTNLIPAAAYLRMSRSHQDKSIESQRTELLAYAAKQGYQIVSWYSDEAISGWKSKQRQSFLQLITDAQGGEFRVVLCWDQDRFSRFEPMEANFYWHQLREAGVTIDTVTDGLLDWESLGGWLTASVKQHGKAEYVKSLAKNIVRGRRRKIMAGKWITFAPYGYRVVDDRLELGDADKVENVRLIFRLRAKGLGIRAICVALREQGIKPLRAQYWTIKQVRDMLRRQVYIGNIVVGKQAKGKFARITDEVVTFENTHEPIIDRETWDAVQRVNDAKTARGPNFSTGKDHGGHLSGLLRCGCCGGKMFSSISRGGWYTCSTYHRGGGCAYNRISHAVAHRIIADKIRSEVLRGSVDALTAEIEKVLTKRRSSKATIDANAITRQIADMDRKLASAAERLLSVDDSLVKTVQAAMQKLKDERDALQAKLSESRQQKPQKSAREIAAGIWQLDEVLKKGDTATIRMALSRFISRVVLDYLPGRDRSPDDAMPLGGTIYFGSSTGDTSLECHKSAAAARPSRCRHSKEANVL